jgi:MFS family permease
VSKTARTVAVAWLVTAVYYFYQYTLRSAPAVMMPELSSAFGMSAVAVASLVGLFYYGYSPFSLVAGAAMDGLGPAASLGRLLQGAGGVFALVGAAYIATTNFPASKAATLFGATQMFGMAGGSAGQFLVGPLIASGVSWSTFWVGMGLAGLVIAVVLHVMLPEPAPAPRRHNWLGEAAVAMGLVFRNPLVWILYGPPVVRPAYLLGLVTGVVSGAAMLPYTVIKEANPPHVSASATGVVNFLNFTFSALLGPVFASMLMRGSGGASQMTVDHYQATFTPLVYGVGLAIVLTLFLKETGPGVRLTAMTPARATS